LSDDNRTKSIDDILRDIERKLSSSAALNGGFDRLMLKVDGIEASQTAIEKKVDDLQDSIYDPDKGLYARIKEIDHQNEMQINDLNRKFNEIKVVEEFEEKSRVEKDAIDKLNRELLSKTVNQLDDLIKWKDLVSSFVKWVIGSGAIGAVGKMLYNMLSNN
jgi:predicted  nucleic acid-binding Zn-ribbon protein